MSKNFASMEELMHHREGMLVIDLLSMALGVDDDECLEALQEPSPGIYLTGRLNPTFRDDEIYLTKGENGASRPAGLSWLMTHFKGESDIYNKDGRIVMTGDQFLKRKRYFTDTPKTPVSMIKILAAIVRSDIVRLTSTVPMGSWFVDVIFREHDGSVTSIENNLYDLIKPEGHHLIERECYETLCGELRDQVKDFIGDDVCNIYRCYLKNSTLYVIKGVDWRIYSFHKDQFEKEEQERENGRNF